MGVEVMLLVSRQGKVRLTKFYKAYEKKEKARIVREISSMVLSRPNKLCNFLAWRTGTIVYKRYASLYFISVIDNKSNELLQLEQIHLYVEILDRYFGNVCELDVIFNFNRCYHILDELLLGGELEETSKREVLRVAAAQDELVEDDIKKETPLNRFKLKA
ncbi:AP-1 complex subunit sigma-1 [Hondaea fermentalgiana]|uniref:AP complex subunit sigma n=1 Tax=Hondaea fermentalgiana TaxID=2315210 RepID=A0A2R5G958_9STRA|nr:AP-1 complex subunit sigma-1 [Hondaea fermentalgiana]|eukprot:GBG27577.1 AP-1 complex subunit sigma-1 [Hondaea fermentalgiana]